MILGEIMSIFKHLFQEKKQDEVIFDDFSISRKMSNGKIENIKWSELRQIQIITTDKGKTFDDAFWLLIGESTGCSIPNQSIGANKLLQKMQMLPGFDNTKVIEAMNSTGNNKYICWKRS